MTRRAVLRRLGVTVGGLVLLAAAGALVLIGASRRDPAPIASREGAVEARGAAEGVPDPAPASVRLFGVILARASVDIAARYEGRVRVVHVRLGDAVPADGLIATLDAPAVRFDLEMAAAVARTSEVELERAELELAEAKERLARRQLLAAEALATGEDLTTARYQAKLAGVRVQAALAQLRERRARVAQLRQQTADAEVRAPFAGTVAARYVDPGTNVTSAMPIIRLITAGDLYVRFAVPEQMARAVQPGQRVRVAAGPGAAVVLSGAVTKIAPEIDAASRMIFVEATLDPGPPAGGQILAGEIASVTLSHEPW